MRGDIVTVAAGSGFGGKPRPALVMQSDLVDLPTVALLLFTSEVDKAGPVRPHILPDGENGLRAPSDLMADLPIAVRREKIGPVIGHLAAADLARVEQALLLVLGFAG